jgi:hypothetical protein
MERAENLENSCVTGLQMREQQQTIALTQKTTRWYPWSGRCRAPAALAAVELDHVALLLRHLVADEELCDSQNSSRPSH